MIYDKKNVNHEIKIVFKRIVFWTFFPFLKFRSEIIKIMNICYSHIHYFYVRILFENEIGKNEKKNSTEIRNN